jgi:hypothetical protein
MTAPPPGRDRYQPLFQLADGHRRLGYQAAAASDQVTVHREYQAALGLLRQLAEVVPVEQDLLRDLAAGHHREGNHAAVMGYGLAARYEYQADLVTVLRQLALADPVTGELLRAALDSAGEDGAAEDGAGEAAPFSARSTSPQAGGGWPGPSEPSEPEQQCQDLGDLAERALAAGDRDTAAASYLALVGLRERLVAVTPGRAQV